MIIQLLAKNNSSAGWHSYFIFCFRSLLLYSTISINCMRSHYVKSRRYTEEDYQFIKYEVKMLLSERVIEPSWSPWRAQVVVHLYRWLIFTRTYTIGFALNTGQLLYIEEQWMYEYLTECAFVYKMYFIRILIELQSLRILPLSHQVLVLIILTCSLSHTRAPTLLYFWAESQIQSDPHHC